MARKLIHKFNWIYAPIIKILDSASDDVDASNDHYVLALILSITVGLIAWIPAILCVPTIRAAFLQWIGIILSFYLISFVIFVALWQLDKGTLEGEIRKIKTMTDFIVYILRNVFIAIISYSALYHYTSLLFPGSLGDGHGLSFIDSLYFSSTVFTSLGSGIAIKGSIAEVAIITETFTSAVFIFFVMPIGIAFAIKQVKNLTKGSDHETSD